MKIYIEGWITAEEANLMRSPGAITIDLAKIVKDEVEKATKDQDKLIKEIVEGELAKSKLKRR